MKYLVILAFLAFGCGDNQILTESPDSGVTGYSPDASLRLAPDSSYKADSSALELRCMAVYAAHQDLVLRCPMSLHGLVSDCRFVIGTLYANNVQACIDWHYNAPCNTNPDKVMWNEVCNDLFLVSE